MPYKNKADKAEYAKQYYHRKPDYFKERARKREQEMKQFILQQKTGMSCKRCGIADVRVLDFHHRDSSEKEGQYNTMLSGGWGRERILRELAKCDVLCANCHRIVHWEERQRLSQCDVHETTP